MWTVDTVVLLANPALEDDWKKVDQVLLQKYEHEDGFELGIEAFAVDTGGHYTHEAYNFVRSCRPHRKAHAIKGADRPGMQLIGRATPVDVNWRGRVIKGGVKLWQIGVNAAKDRLFGLMRAEVPQIHFSHELDDDFYDQITAEQRVPQKSARGKRYVWVKRKGHARNERLDCATYVVWLVERLKISTWPARIWEMRRASLLETAGIRAVVEPRQPESPGPMSPEITRRRSGLSSAQRGSSWVNKWRR
jgi:phage terminase large subunit GpA-like protein